MFTWAVHVRSTGNRQLQWIKTDHFRGLSKRGLVLSLYSHANKTHFHKKGCALGLILKMNVLGTQKWPIEQT